MPKTLLDLSAHFHCAHVSLPHIWLKWGAKSSSTSSATGEAAEETGALAMEDTEFLDTASKGAREAFDILDEDTLARAANPSLPAPFAATSAAVAEKVKGRNCICFPALAAHFLRQVHCHSQICSRKWMIATRQLRAVTLTKQSDCLAISSRT